MSIGTSVYIDISIQTSEGPRRFSHFDLGHDKEAAQQLFKKLKGSPQVDVRGMLYIELMELVNGLPVNL